MKTIGLIAGNGRFPVLSAKEAQKLRYRVVICGIQKEADSSLESLADVFCWIKIGELGKLIKFFKKEGVSRVVMAGKIEKVRFFQENVHLDFEMMKAIMKIRDFKDDSLLGAIANYLNGQGIELLDSTFLMKNIMPGAGILGKKKPSKSVMEDIKFGFSAAKDIAGADIGQTVVVKNKTVLAVEAIEGTDEAIRRGGELGREKVVVVKVAKPKQDMRFDVPAVGLKTLERLISVKAEAFAFEAGKTLFLDIDEFIKKANDAKIAVIGL